MAPTITDLIETLPQRGTISWIGVRPGRHEPLDIVNEVRATPESGLAGDRYSGRTGKRQVTLIQQEHLGVMASVLGREVTVEHLRRNICVSGINLLALKGRVFTAGEVELEFTGLAHPCSFMEETLGPGGYNAVRGHGGITARVITEGVIRVGDNVAAGGRIAT